MHADDHGDHDDDHHDDHDEDHDEDHHDDHHDDHDEDHHDDHHDDHAGHAHDHGDTSYKRTDVRGYFQVRYAPNDRLSVSVDWKPYYVTRNQGDAYRGLKNDIGAEVVWALQQNQYVDSSLNSYLVCRNAVHHQASH